MASINSAVRKKEQGGEPNEKDMHHYIVLGTYTDQGLRELKGKPKSDNARRILERLGGKMQLYYTLGEYDFVAIVDLPREENMLRFLSEIDSLGYVRSTALKAWSEKEVAHLLSTPRSSS